MENTLDSRSEKGEKRGASVDSVSVRKNPSSRRQSADSGDFTAVFIFLEHGFSNRFTKNFLAVVFQTLKQAGP